MIDIPTYRNHREGAERERVFEDVKFACGGIPDSVVHHIQFDRLDFGVGEVLDKFYAADVAIIDLSVQVSFNKSDVFHLLYSHNHSNFDR